MKADCWAKSRGKEGQEPKGKGKSQPKKEQAVTAAANSDDAASMAYNCGSADIVLDNCGDMFDNLFGDSDDDPESSDDENSPAEWIHNETKGPLVEDDEGEAYTRYKAAMLHTTVNTAILHKLSYMTQALRDTCPPIATTLLISYPLSQRLLQLRTNFAFDASGRGDMEIEVPLGNRKLSKVLLKNMLYAQDIGVTLVSISHITAAGHKAIFDGPSLKIYNSSKKLLGEVPVN
jgi:hypothetical protein